MAKGLRSSVKKTNRSKLKSNVFGPIEDERAARLSAKLMELASQPRSSNTEMEIDTGADSKKDGDPDLEPSDQREDMELDGRKIAKPSHSKSKARSKIGKVRGKRRVKSTSQRTFPSMERAKRKAAEKKRKLR